MLNVAAALRLQADESPPSRSRLTLNACANQVERAATILEVAAEGLESLGGEFFAECYALQLRLALLRLRGKEPQTDNSPIGASPRSGPSNRLDTQKPPTTEGREER